MTRVRSSPSHAAGERQMTKSRAAGLILLLVLLAPAGSARAQVESREGIALQNQILELRRQVQTLQDQGARGRQHSDLSGRRPLIPRRPEGAAIWSRSCWRAWTRWRSRSANFVGASTRHRTRCSARAPIWASGSMTWRSRRRAPPAPERPRPQLRHLPIWRLRDRLRSLARHLSAGHRSYPSKRAMLRWLGATTPPQNSRRVRC